MNDIYIGNGHIDAFTIPSQSSVTKRLMQKVYLNQIEKLVSSIINKNGYVDIEIRGYAHVAFLNVPLELLKKRINVYEVIKEAIKRKLSGYTPPRGLRVISAYWMTNGNRIYSAKPFTLVHAFVTISGNPSYNGEVTVMIKEDNRALPDTTVKSQECYVSLSSGESKTIELTFTPEYHSYSRG